jgi:hypothetical protein
MEQEWLTQSGPATKRSAPGSALHLSLLQATSSADRSARQRPTLKKMELLAEENTATTRAPTMEGKRPLIALTRSHCHLAYRVRARFW